MIELRDYQKAIIRTALLHNTLVVLPTGLGKTLIAFHVIQRYKKALFLAPTKPLVEQHGKNFQEILGHDIEIATGTTKNRDYDQRFIFATPQTVMSDIDILSKDHFDFIVFDEAHRAVGNYDYVKIASYFTKARTMGMTASPGHKMDRIMGILKNLRIDMIEYRKENDPEILKHLHIRNIKTLMVDLPEDYKKITDMLDNKIKDIKDELEHRLEIKINKYNVKDVGKRIEQIEGNDRWKLWQNYSKLLTYMHVKELIEIQSIEASIRYLKELKEQGSRAQLEIVDELMNNIKTHYKIHPKTELLLKILSKEQDRQGIVFSQYKTQIFYLSDILTSNNITHDILIGGGVSKKRQMESIQKFIDGQAKVLLSSSVGEEGLDLPAADYVVFYESIPSPIRVIQRMGRTARSKDGDVYILITKDTYDELSYRLANRRIKMMYQNLENLRSMLINKNKTIFDQLK